VKYHQDDVIKLEGSFSKTLTESMLGPPKVLHKSTRLVIL